MMTLRQKDGDEQVKRPFKFQRFYRPGKRARERGRAVGIATRALHDSLYLCGFSFAAPNEQRSKQEVIAKFR
jgi:hypothetical protein